MEKYTLDQIVYFIGDQYNAPHLSRIVALWPEYPNECRLDTIGNQDLCNIRPFYTYHESISKTYQPD